MTSKAQLFRFLSSLFLSSFCNIAMLVSPRKTGFDALKEVSCQHTGGKIMKVRLIVNAFVPCIVNANSSSLCWCFWSHIRLWIALAEIGLSAFAEWMKIHRELRVLVCQSWELLLRTGWNVKRGHWGPLWQDWELLRTEIFLFWPQSLCAICDSTLSLSLLWKIIQLP